jgi:hypothetical protein
VSLSELSCNQGNEISCSNTRWSLTWTAFSAVFTCIVFKFKYEEDFTALLIKIIVVWDVTPRYLLIRGRAMAQAVSSWPLTAEVRVRSRFSLCGICGGQSGTGTGFSTSTSVFPYQCHSIGAPLQGKRKNKHIFITGLQNKRRGCGASVASAAAPFTTRKNGILTDDYEHHAA